MKRRTTVTPFMCLLLLASNVWAQNEPSSIYIPPENGKSPQILDKTTGTARALLLGKGGEAPADCPPESYWYNDSILRSCADGAKFVLKPLDNGKYPAGYMAVKPLDPNDETREPGPDIQDWNG